MNISKVDNEDIACTLNCGDNKIHLVLADDSKISQNCETIVIVNPNIELH